MTESWIATTSGAAAMVAVSAIGIYITLVFFTRLAGLRSFSKMSGFDFAVTVAFGSLLAATLLTKDPPLLQAIVGLALLFLLQYGVSLLRLRSKAVADLVDNDPILIMSGNEILEENMHRARMTRTDLFSKLREANVTDLNQVKAVVMEVTGDVSVLHGDPDAAPLDARLLLGVRGAERFQ